MDAFSYVVENEICRIIPPIENLKVASIFYSDDSFEEESQNCNNHKVQICKRQKLIKEIEDINEEIKPINLSQSERIELNKSKDVQMLLHRKELEKQMNLELAILTEELHRKYKIERNRCIAVEKCKWSKIVNDLKQAIAEKDAIICKLLIER